MVTLVPFDHHSSKLADAVIKEIAKNDDEIQQQQQPLRKIAEKHPPQNAIQKKWTRWQFIGALAAILCIVALIGSLAIARDQQGLINQSSHRGLIGPTVWEFYQNQTLVQNPEGTFCIKWISVTSREFRFFYVFKSNYKSPRQVAVSSYSTSVFGPQTTLTTTVQSLGQLGDFTSGVIHANRNNVAGQIIAIDISFFRLTATLAPLKQLINDQNWSHYEFSVDQSKLPAVFFSGPVQGEQVAYFRRVLSGQPVANMPHIFIRMDNPATVSVITKKEYLSIAGSANFAP